MSKQIIVSTAAVAAALTAAAAATTISIVLSQVNRSLKNLKSNSTCDENAEVKPDNIHEEPNESDNTDDITVNQSHSVAESDIVQTVHENASATLITRFKSTLFHTVNPSYMWSTFHNILHNVDIRAHIPTSVASLLSNFITDTFQVRTIKHTNRLPTTVTWSDLQRNFACDICHDVLAAPHVLSCCGMSCCAVCLLGNDIDNFDGSGQMFAYPCKCGDIHVSPAQQVIFGRQFSELIVNEVNKCCHCDGRTKWEGRFKRYLQRSVTPPTPPSPTANSSVVISILEAALTVAVAIDTLDMKWRAQRQVQHTMRMMGGYFR